MRVVLESPARTRELDQVGHCNSCNAVLSIYQCSSMFTTLAHELAHWYLFHYVGNASGSSDYEVNIHSMARFVEDREVKMVLDNFMKAWLHYCLKQNLPATSNSESDPLATSVGLPDPLHKDVSLPPLVKKRGRPPLKKGRKSSSPKKGAAKQGR